MRENIFFKVRLYFTGIITVGIWGLLIWNHYHGGVPSHHILNRENLPEISNWWGGLVLPLLTLLLTYRLRKRILRNNDNASSSTSLPLKVVYRFLFALLFGILLSVFFTLGYSSVSGGMIRSLFVLALLFPIYRAECLLGFVLGMTYTFGAVLPVAIGGILLFIASVLYLYVRPVLLYILKKIKSMVWQNSSSSTTKVILIVVSTFLLSFYKSNAQKNVIVKGEVKDENQKPIDAVTISIVKAKDTSLISRTLTNKNGVYIIEGIKPNNYMILISASGYLKTSIPLNIIKEDHIIMPVAILVTEIKTLKEVIVQAQRPLFEQKSDRVVVNIAASPSNAGANALEILEKSPGITVDKDGNISLKGKAGVQIFIDGKPSYLSGQDLVNYLKNIQGAQLDQIEIMTNPPAKYDAAGNSGIINIKAKKAIQFGYNVSVNTGYTQGIYARSNQDVNFNFRKNGVNLFGAISRNERNTQRTFILDRKFVDPVSKDIKTLLNQESDKSNWNAANSFKLGTDLFLTGKTTIGATVNGFYNPENSISTGTIYILNPNNTLQASTFSSSESKSSWKNFSSNVNLRHVFDNTGKELTSDLDYIYYAGTNAQNLSNYFYNASGAITGKPDTLYGNLPQLINIYSAKVDYVHPLKKGAKLEAGIKAAYVKTDANAGYDSLINKRLVPDVGRSNHFVYDERISAVYISYSHIVSEKISSQLGLRIENTVANGSQLTTGEKFKFGYTQVFPTAYLSYKANEKNTWTINYGRRIRRPDYESLNPFVKFLDRYTFEQGNPNLRPQFSHNIELSHSFKSFITTTLNYTKTSNVIQMVMKQNESTNQTFAKQENIASQQQYGLAITILKQMKAFTGNLYINIYNNEFSGLLNNEFITIGATTAVFNTSLSYKCKNGIATEINAFYRTPGVEGIFRINALGGVNVGASMPVLKNKGTLRVSVRDIFWTQKANGYVRFGTIDTKFQQIPDSRTIGLNFSYRISKGKLNNNKRKVSGANDELNRVKGSDN